MWPNPKETADLVTSTEGILNGKLHFFCSDIFLPSHLLNDLSEKCSLCQNFIKNGGVTIHSLLITRRKICSLLVAEVACCKK